MKHIFFKFFVCIVVMNPSLSHSFTKKIIEYNKTNFLIEENEILEDLTSTDSFNGKYFKVVLGKSNIAIKFNDKLHSEKASNLYHHLTKAYKFFKSIGNSNLKHINKKIIIRMDITNSFDPYAHFAHDDYQKDFNTALTIPKSNETRLNSVEPWQNEIWFRPSKQIYLSSENPILSLFSSRESKTTLELMLVDNALYRYFNNGISRQTLDVLSNDRSILYLAAGLIGIELLPFIIRMVKKDTKKLYYLDTAMIPEIIYHEYAHFALSDHIPLTSTPVIEGYANFYAGQISNRAKWGNGPRKYSLDQGRNAYMKDLYSYGLESNFFSTSSYVYKLLWGLKRQFSDEEINILIYNSRKYINKESNIKNGLLDSLYKSLPIINKNDNYHRLNFHKYMQEQGL